MFDEAAEVLTSLWHEGTATLSNPVHISISEPSLVSFLEVAKMPESLLIVTMRGAGFAETSP